LNRAARGGTRFETPMNVRARTRKALRVRYDFQRRLRRIARLWRVYILRLELRFAPSEAQRLFLLTVTIGAVCGLSAVAFHLCIGFLENHLVERSLNAPGRSWIAWTIATPTLGGLVCGILLRYVVPNARGSGIPQVKAAFASESPAVPFRDAVGKFVVGSLQIGSGASLGREGPTVQICAGIASTLGRVVSVSPQSQRRLLPVGVAAGIAAALNAPIAAVTFTIEEIVGSLDQAVLSGVIVAAALAAVIERRLLGESAVFALQGNHSFRQPSSLLVYAAIGLAAAVASVVFMGSLLRLRLWFRRVPIPSWSKPAFGGLVTGLLAVAALLGLGASGVTGGGYSTLGEALNGRVAWNVMLGLSALKLLATVASYSSGGAGGIFAPTLFIGGTLGGAIGTLDAVWLGHADEPVGAFVLVGMGAMFAGVIRAPITSVLIIVEMTDGYSLILPLMLANMTAYVIARRFRPKAIYEALLEQDGVKLERAAAENLELPSIASLMRRTDLDLFTVGTPALEILQVCKAKGASHVYPVVDAERRLLGLLMPDELVILSKEPELARVATTLDMMREPVSIDVGYDVAAAVEAMLSSGLRELPVTDELGRLVGMIDDKTISRAYQSKATR
jgi:CIC family chloride channel protein